MLHTSNLPVLAAIRYRALVVGLLVLVCPPSFAEEAAPQVSVPKGDEAVVPQDSASKPKESKDAASQASAKNVNVEGQQASVSKELNEATPQVSAPNGNTAAAVALDPIGKAVSHYRLQPGDVLQISVWKETDLQSDVLIRPDGGFSFPLVGDFDVVGKTIEQLRAEFTQRIQRFVPDAIVSISLKQPQGHRVYVVGRVNRPGEYPALREVDVMQALSMAGGATPFASLNSIKVLRRINGKQQVFNFRYSDIESGKDLEQNITLQGGDIVVVP